MAWQERVSPDALRSIPVLTPHSPFFLFKHLPTFSVNETYKEYAYISACGVPGSIIATWLVELPRTGRRGALAVSTLATGVFIFGLTGAKSNTAYLVLNCFATLVQNSMVCRFAFSLEEGTFFC